MKRAAPSMRYVYFCSMRFFFRVMFLFVVQFNFGFPGCRVINPKAHQTENIRLFKKLWFCLLSSIGVLVLDPGLICLAFPSFSSSFIKHQDIVVIKGFNIFKYFPVFRIRIQLGLYRCRNPGLPKWFPQKKRKDEKNFMLKSSNFDFLS